MTDIRRACPYCGAPERFGHGPSGVVCVPCGRSIEDCAYLFSAEAMRRVRELVTTADTIQKWFATHIAVGHALTSGIGTRDVEALRAVTLPLYAKRLDAVRELLPEDED